MDGIGQVLLLVLSAARTSTSWDPPPAGRGQRGDRQLAVRAAGVKQPSSRRDGFRFLGIGITAAWPVAPNRSLHPSGRSAWPASPGTLSIGAAGVALAAVVALAFVVVCRRQSASCDTDPAEPVPVTAPTHKVPTSNDHPAEA